MDEEREDVLCPFGGDVADDCDGCAYSGDYRYDPVKKACVERT